MADTAAESRTSYPYLTANQWFGLRGRLKQSPPRAIGTDWIISALDTTQRSAQNVLPQLRTLGLIDGEGRTTDLVHDLRDDQTYRTAVSTIVERVYPENLRTSYDDPGADSAKVASWFARNARTGELMSKNQAKTYLMLLAGELPADDDPRSRPQPRRRESGKQGDQTKSSASGRPAAAAQEVPAPTVHTASIASPAVPASGLPTIHIDLQIHISPESDEAQIEALFKNMAKYLYGR